MSVPTLYSKAGADAAISKLSRARALRSKLIIPGAPFQRRTYPSPPTIVANTSAGAAYTGSRTVPISPSSPYVCLASAGGWGQNGSAPNGWSPAHVYPHTNPGRKYHRMIFGYDGSKFALQVTSAPGHRYRMRVDGQYLSASSVAGVGGGANSWLTVDFGSDASRIIEIEQVAADVVALLVGPTASVWSIPPRGPRCIFVGDSYIGGSGSPATGYSAIESCLTSFADTLGWQDVWNSGIGGTGYITRNSGQTNNYLDRVQADVIDYAPDVVVVMGARNDYPSGASAVGVAAGSLFAALRAGLPNSLLVVVGPNGSASPVDGSADTTWKPFQDAIFAATVGLADVQLDYSASGIFTGSGKAGATTGSGNGDIYMQADGVHPTEAGAVYLGARLAHKLIGALTAA